jgi:hypothetical protein
MDRFSNHRVRKQGWEALERADLTPEEKKAAIERALSQAKSIHATFASPVGQEALEVLSSKAYKAPSFNFKSENAALEAAFVAGMREMVEFIFHKINLAEKGYPHE